MRSAWSLAGALFLLLLAGAVAWVFGLHGAIRASIASGHLIDWVIAGLALFWLPVVLKYPWDLYFQAHTVAFELERSRERGIAIRPGREEYVHRLRRRLAWLAVGAHWVSAAVVAAATAFSHGAIGYYFAAFYLLSTVYRPALAGYEYLSTKLFSLAEEATHPREDVVTLRLRMDDMEHRLEQSRAEEKQLRQGLTQEAETRTRENRELARQTRAARDRIDDVAREFESAVARVSDRQELIQGIQAFVRLIAESSRETRNGAA